MSELFPEETVDAVAQLLYALYDRHPAPWCGLSAVARTDWRADAEAVLVRIAALKNPLALSPDADLVTTGEAAARLDVSRQRVLQLIGDGDLRAVRSRRDCWAVSAEDVDREARRREDER